MKRTPAEMYQTFDNHGAPIWVRLPPPSRWDYQRKHARARRAAVYAGLALVAFMLLALLWLAATARPAQGATDRPGKAAWTCRHRLVHVSARDTTYRWECRRVK